MCVCGFCVCVFFLYICLRLYVCVLQTDWVRVLFLPFKANCTLYLYMLYLLNLVTSVHVKHLEWLLLMKCAMVLPCLPYRSGSSVWALLKDPSERKPVTQKLSADHIFLCFSFQKLVLYSASLGLFCSLCKHIKKEISKY